MSAAISPPLTGRRPIFAAAAIAGMLVTLYSVNLGGWRTLGAHEALAAVPARAMADGSGDWLIPDFGGIPRVKKPPLGYWLIAASIRLTGVADEFAARLPSALSAVALAGLIGSWGARWYGRRAGLAAALVQGTSLWALTYGRKSEVDITLSLLTAAALFLAVGTRDRGPVGRVRLRWIAVWALAGLGWLGKFHFIPCLIAAPLVGHWLLCGRTHKWRTACSPIGVGLFLLLALPWTAWMAANVPAATDAWFVQTAGRAGGELGVRSLGFYPLQLLILTLPWTPCWLLIAARTFRRSGRKAASAWRRTSNGPLGRQLQAALRSVTGRSAEAKERATRDLFPWVWLATTVFVLSLSLGRNRHYLLPALPACSLAAGRGAAVFWAICRNGWAWAGWLRGPRTAVASWLLPMAGTAAFAVVMLTIAPSADGRAANARFVRSLPARSPIDEPILVLGMGESSALWHLPSGARRTETADGLAAALTENRRLAVLADRRSIPLIDECATRWRAAGGSFAVRWIAAETEAPEPRDNAFEPMHGLRFAVIEVGPTVRPLVRSSSRDDSVIRR
ncbi:MAG: glycosyltransferase family 39 protein [Planctomycetota bacterium]